MPDARASGALGRAGALRAGLRVPALSDVPLVVRDALAGAALTALVVVGFFIAAGATANPSHIVPASRHAGYPDWMRGVLRVFGTGLELHDFGVLVLVMFGCYLVVLACADRVRRRWAMAAILAAYVVFTVAPPILSGDVFGYLDFARIGAVHEENPYVIVPLAAPADAIDPFVGWPHLTTPYGPLFTLASYPLAFLSVPAGLWTFKALAGLAGLGIVALVALCARLRGRDPVPAALLVGLNPLVLVWGVGGAHNDMLLTLLVVGALALALSARPAGAGGLLAGATLFKPSSVLLLPFMVLGARDRRRTLRGAAAVAVVLGAAALIAFGSHAFDFLHVVKTQQDLVSLNSVPHKLGELLGYGGLTEGIRVLAGIGLAAALVFLLVRTHRGADWLTSVGWATLALLLSSAWLLPWYIVWLLPLAALSEGRSLRLAALALTTFIVLTRALSTF